MTDTASEGASPIAGEVVQVDAVVPSVEAVKAEGKSRVGNSGAQQLIATQFVSLLVWMLRLNNIDLNPLPDAADIPAEVATNLAGLLAFGLAYLMNRKRLRGES